jgi:amidase
VIEPAKMSNSPPDSLAFCTENHVSLLGNPSGSLVDLTFAVKDIFDIEGAKTGFGNPTWLKTHGPATTTAAAVKLLVDAGAHMIGKTLTDEMAYSLTGENAHYGTPQNPVNPERIPGGSSNGSASAVAAGLVDFALGTDCGGSVRLPASYCGIFGIRPSLGRVSLDGVIPFSASFDVAGWFARDAQMLARVGKVLFEKSPQTIVANPVVANRLLIAEDAFDFVEPAVKTALQSALRHVSARFDRCQSINIYNDAIENWRNVFQTIQASEIWANHGQWITQHHPDFGPGIRERMDSASCIDPDAVAAARKRHAEIKFHLDDLIGETDVLCLPSSARIAPLKNTPVDEIEIDFRNQAMCLLCVSGLGGLPQISLPLAQLNGMPLGLSLISRGGNDEMLLDLARVICD